jgi:hypothetical protein
MIGIGDLYEMETQRNECGSVVCTCGDEFVPAYSGDICEGCKARESSRSHPECACGRLATMVADVVVGGRIVERRPWCSSECCLLDNTGAKVDVIADSVALPVVIEYRPCWCGMRNIATCDWCPDHGWRS